MGYFVIRSPNKLLPVFSSKGRTKGQRDDSRASLLEGEAAAAAVPKGCLAVYVGQDMRRFVIPASYLGLPAFRALMARVAEEFGFEQTGGLRIPCDEETFLEILGMLEETTSRSKKKIKEIRRLI